MKKLNSLSKIFILLFIGLTIFTHTAQAADKWFYWVNTPDEEYGILGRTTGFNTKAECESSNPGYKTIGAGRVKSNGCYSGSDVRITSIVPSSGKPGDIIDINGANFFQTTKVIFGGGISVDSSSFGVHEKALNGIKIPQGATTGKITVETKYRGKATSAKDFSVIAQVASSDPWTFLNAQNQYYQSYVTEAECKTEHQKYNVMAGIVNPTDACVQRTQQQITASQVLKDNAQSVDAQKETPPDTSTYTLLAPIGDQTEIKTNNIGNYFNTIFQIAIGLCGVLAVIMIVISAVQYMGDESVFGKTEAKSGIKMALLGLIIAIGAYAILNTINPALTGKDGLSLDQVSAQIDEDVETVESVGTYTPTGGNSKLCTSGFTSVDTYGNGTAVSPKKISICKSLGGIPLSNNLKKMLDKAKADGIILSGWGARSYETQVQLRKDHHCADIYNASPSTCKPPTARPGKSNHEVGGAVDFTCNGQSMTSSGGRNSVCFKWLAANASTYGFKNLASESWHWSFNGK